MLATALLIASLPMQPAPEFREQVRERFEARFAAADRNSDGRIDRDEAAAMPRAAVNFDAIDVDKSGDVTREELLAHAQRMREALRRARGAQ